MNPEGEWVLEQEMSELLGRYKMLFESSHDGIFIHNDYELIDCNERALRMLCCSRSQIIGRAPLDIFASMQADGITAEEKMRDMLNDALHDRHGFFEWQARRSDGSIFDVEINLRRMELGGRIVMQTVMRDITQRKLAEEALSTSETQFYSCFESAAIGMAIVSTTGRLLRVNQALCHTLGYTQEELHAKTFQQITHPDDLESDLEKFKETLAGRMHSYHMEKRYFHKSGAIITVHLSVSIVRDRHNKPLHFTSQIEDITERKRLEELFRQSQKMEAVGQLAGGIAHDFNNILTVIQGYTTLLQNQTISHEEGLSQIAESAERAASLTRQLLTFSRKQVMEQRTLDINMVVRQTAKMLTRTLGEAVTLNLICGDDLPVLHADECMMEQVILNLAVNARDAMKRGGQLTIETSSDVISAEAARQNIDARPGLAVKLSVTDTGCGIPAEDLTRIFEPFFTTKEVNKGTGLGLATVHGIVRQHGGLIRLQSEIGKGTKFQILLPAARLKKAPATPRPKDRNIEGGSETILLVDDEPALRLVSKLTLTAFGYKVLEACCGKEAIKLMEENPHHIDLLLTDMVMPGGINGRQLAEHLKSSRPDLRVLFTSGYSSDLLSENLSIPDEINFLPKPFSTEKLAHAVRDCLKV